MVKIFFIKAAALLVMLSVAMYGQVFAELKALETSSHLAAYSDHDDDEAHTQDSDHHHEHAKSHTHKHRHAPDEPEHTHVDIGLIATPVLTNPSPSISVSRLEENPLPEVKPFSDEFIPTGWILSCPFRPPIA